MLNQEIPGENRTRQSTYNQRAGASGIKLALVMAIGGAVVALPLSLRIFHFGPPWSFLEWLTAVAVASLLPCMFGGLVGVTVGITLEARKSWQSRSLMVGGIVGGLFGPIALAILLIFVHGLADLRVPQPDFDLLRFDLASAVFCLTVFGGLFGVCFGAIGGWVFGVVQRSLRAAIGRAAGLAAIIGFLIALTRD